MKNKYFKRIVSTILLCGSFSMSYATDWYISSTGNDANDGLTALTPKASFSAAQTAASAGDVIYVSGMIDFSLEPGITLPNGVAINKNLTIQGTSNTIDGFDGMNLTRFFTTAGFNLTISNLKLTKGLVNPGNGGAISLNGGTLTLTNVNFDNNRAVLGGALYLASGTVTMNGCTIQNNDNTAITGSKGGAIYILPTAAVTLNANNTVIKNNKTLTDGGALYYLDSSVNATILKFTNCAFISNTTGGTTLGGAAYINNATASATLGLTFINSTIYDNAAGGASGGAMLVNNLKTGSVIDFRNCTITGNRVLINTNTAAASAGIRVISTVTAGGGVIKIYNSILENNYAPLASVSGTSNIYTTDFAWQGEGFTAGTNLIIENSMIGKPATNAKYPAASFPTSKLNYVTVINSDVRNSYLAKFGTFNSTNNTLPLTANSFALDFGKGTNLSSLSPSVTTDQLGTTRPFTGGLCSAGSVEFIPTAGQKIWKGISADGTLASNWFPAGAPAVTDFISVSAGKSFNPSFPADLTINGGAIATGASLTVTDALINNGVLTLENNAYLIQVNSTSNSGSGSFVIKRNSNSLFRSDYTMWSSPIENATQTLAQFSPATTASRFYTYNSSTNVYNSIAGSTPFSTGKGYLIRMPNNDPLMGYNEGTTTLAFPGQFTGSSVNNGTFSVSFSSLNAGDFVAVGNPYPSNMNADLFIASNTDSPGAGVLYFWRKTNAVVGSAYATYTLAGGVGTVGANGGFSPNTPNTRIALGQGFITTLPSSKNITFNNGMRSASTANFLRTKQTVEKSRIWINLTDANGAFSQMLLAYMDGATTGIDAGIDGKYINDNATALTSDIAGGEYVIQGRPAFEPTDMVKLNLKVENAGTYTIAKDQVDGLFANGQDFYLVDNATGIETNLQNDAYSFTASAGTDNARFSLKFQKTLKIQTSQFNDNSVKVFKNNGVLNVSSGIIAISNIKVFDIQGRLVAEQKNVNATSATIRDVKLNHQVLIVKVTGADNTVVAKKVLN